jgi:DNA-binding IclR family transcriptional regulator
MTDEAGGSIARRDELLELLYWLEGEGFGGVATLSQITRFLAYEESEVEATLEFLVRRGDVRFEPDTAEYRLTETGRGEAARRFAEEFAPLLSQGHGECNDPNCDCHTNPAGAAECHAARAQHRH